MKPKELISWISRVETLLGEFSFEELDATEAKTLKNSFELFKEQLHDTISGNEISNSKLSNTLESNCYTTSRKPNSGAELIANVSHELRTPLNGIIGFTDLLKEDSLNEAQMVHVNAIQNASSSLMDIVNELLEYSKLSAKRELFDSVHFNFYRLLRDVVFLCETLIVQKNVKLEMLIDPSIPEVLVGDPTKLSQVLLNLLGNAIKFIEEGNIDFKIILEKKKEKELLLEFTIADNGIGIDESKLPFIFDSFRQADKETSNTYGGTGLGLSIVKQIVTQLGGAISVVSNLDMGTTFKFQLPFTVGDKTQLRKKNPNNNYLKDGVKLIKGTRILVFEDNSLNQRLIERRLKKWDCVSFITENAEYGINVLENQNIDLVLMDLRMPQMSGFEVSSLIRNHNSITVSQVPIIALTGDFTIKDKEISEMHGMNDYLLKPYSPDELLLKLLKNKKNGRTSENSKETEQPLDSKTILEVDKFSLDHIVEDCMGQLDLVEELISLYKENVLEFIGKIKYYLPERDFEAMGFALHKIKSGLAMMRTNSLYEIIREMSTCCKTTEDTGQLNVLFENFVSEYPNVERQIDAELEKLKIG